MGFDGNSAGRRRRTRNSIYRHIYSSKDFCSRQSLAHELGLSLPTVYQNLSELMAEGLVRDSGEQQSTGGRRASGLSVVPDARIAVGISVTGHKLRLAAADLMLNELAYLEEEHGPIDSFAGLGGSLSRALEEFLDRLSLERERLLGVGIALPAVMSPDSRYITAAPTLNIRNTSLEGLTDSIPYPTYVENDATCGGCAELFARAGKGNMAYLSLENGVGGAILFEGSPYSGDNRRSAEFGHMCVEPGGLPCACGARGCLEAYCSPRRILDAFPGIPIEEFFSEMERHGPQSREYEALWDNMLRHLAIGVNNIHMALDCDVVIGGSLSEHLEPYMSRLREYTAGANNLVPDAGYLHLSTLRRHTVPLGVALHFVTEFLDNV